MNREEHEECLRSDIPRQEGWDGDGVTITLTTGFSDGDLWHYANEQGVELVDASAAVDFAESLIKEMLEHAAEEYKKRYKDTLPEFEITSVCED